MSDILAIEQKSMTVAKWSNLAMAAAGIGAGLMASADALLLDGLFSGLGFVTAIAGAWVARSVQRAPDAARPFGYEIDETLYVMFRSLLLLGIIAMALLSSLNRLGIYLLKGEGVAPDLSWITAYAGGMVVVCFGLYFYHMANWRRSGAQSTLLQAEARAVLVDGVMSLGAGLAFVAIAFLKGGPLDALVPVSDAIIVLILCLVMLPQPLKMFLNALGEAAGVSLPPKEVEEIRAEARTCLAEHPFELLDVGAARTGRALFFLIYLKPLGAVSLAQITAAREALSAQTEGHRLELVLQETAPYGAVSGANSGA